MGEGDQNMPRAAGAAGGAATDAGSCPVCGAPGAAKVRPFCSRACADIDLLRWLRGGYVIAGKSVDEDEDGEAETTLAQGSDRDDEPSR